MRLLELALLAFGPFSNLTLSFRAPGPKLVVVHGRNEAGKSTVLRAVSALLYGIPRRTTDVQVHTASALRIGGVLELEDGTELHLVRRRSDFADLLDPAGQPMDEAVLTRALGGLPQSLFGAMFGLSHDSLREGADALLRGGGDVGESLFDASLGGRAVHDVLGELRRESDALFRPRGKSPRLNVALRRLREAKERSRKAGLGLDAWLQQEQAIAQAGSEIEQLKQRRHRLRVEHKGLERARQVLPLLGRLQQLRGKRSALGDVVLLPSSASSERVELQRKLLACLSERQRVEQDTATLTLRRRELVVREELAQVDEPTMEALTADFGRFRAAASDLPRRRAEAKALREEVRTSLDRLSCVRSIDQARETRVPSALQARIRRLAHEQGALEASISQLERNAGNRRRKLDALAAQMSSLPAVQGLEPLRRALVAAQGLGDIDSIIGQRRAEREQIKTRTEVEAASLGLSSADPAALVALALPGIETVELHASQQRERDARRAELTRRERELLRSKSDTQQQIDELRRQGDVPTESELGERRQARARAWQQLRAHMGRPARNDVPGIPAAPLGCQPGERVTPAGQGSDSACGDRVLAYEQLVAETDEIADRLRREAGRVAKLAGLLAATSRHDNDSQRLQAEQRELTGSEQAGQRAWNELWSPRGLSPASPVEMRGWMARFQELRAQAMRQLELDRELERLVARRRQQRALLRERLGEAGRCHQAEQSTDTLGPVIDQALALVAELEQRASQARMLAQSFQIEQAELGDLEREVGDSTLAHATWSASWKEAIVQLGIPAEATPAEALAELDAFVNVRSKLAELDRLERRIGAMERDGERFLARARELAERTCPELRDLQPEVAAERLLRMQRNHKQRLEARRRLDEDLADKRELLAELSGREAQAQRGLALLMQAARATSIERLELAEQQSEAALRLDSELLETEAQLLAAGQGAGLETLLAETRDLDVDAVGVRSAETESELEQIEQELERASEILVRNEAGLALQKDRSAAQAAAEVQHCVAEVAAHARGYLRARLATLVLEREIERYCNEYQAPLLARASELVQALTLGRYTQVHAAVDSRGGTALRCERNDGVQVPVDGLSDGTRDQLYLALRLASLERYAARGCGLPLVLDDALVHFDDKRAAAALRVLSDLTRRTQVLLFTHHTQVVDLARKAVGRQLLLERDLPEPTQPRPAQPALPLGP
ncbi:MAG: AAA family ATPase [Proteobacteria bacterium]|nr:AAA family ATPase [Pseudomonadota bacterium]